MRNVLYLPLLLLCLPLWCLGQHNTASTGDNSLSINTLIHNPDPDCTPPRNLYVKESGERYVIMAWEGKPAAAGDVEYFVRYWPMNNTALVWEKNVEQGNEIKLDRLEEGAEYAVEVSKICYWTDGSQIISKPLRAEHIIPISKADVVTGCGSPYSFGECLGPYAQQGNWQNLTIGGLSIQVLTNIPVGTGPGESIIKWTGTGRLTLPFNGRIVRVKWNLVDITPAGKICGNVEGISDIPANFPDLSPKPAVFGDEICKKPPSQPGFDANGIHSETGQPWDPRGFDKDGKYAKEPPYPGWAPPMPRDSLLDPNGFDRDGKHFETGTEFGPNGCNQLGFDKDGQKCKKDTVPYYWLQTDQPNSEGAHKLYEKVKDSLAFFINQNLRFWQSTSVDTVNQITTQCNGIRTEMNGLMVALGYQADRQLVFGPNDLYFNTGMWKHFSTEPKTLSVEITRDPNQVQLEAKHIDLYHCDKRLDTYAVFKHLVDSLLAASTGITDLKGAMKGLIYELSDADANKLIASRSEFHAWLKDHLRKYISETWCGGTCATDPHMRKQRNINPFCQEDGDNGLLAKISTPFNHFQPSSTLINSFQPQSLGSLDAFQHSALLDVLLEGKEKCKMARKQYLDGEEYINGVHRAFYLEAIGESRKYEGSGPFYFTAPNPELMPVDVSNRASDGRKYSIWMDGFFFTPTGAFMDAYMVLELPNSGKKVVFSALDLSFTPNGFITNPATLQLANDVVFRMSNAVQIKLKKGPNTFVSFDCEGYAGIGLDLDVEVCRDYVKPLNAATMAPLPEPERVKASVQLFLPTFDELYAQVNITPFVITGIEDYKWVVNSIVIDFSDVASPNLPPPPGYKSSFATPAGFSPLWRGFYMSELSCTMPNQFKDGGAPLTVGVERLVLDNMGCSGRVFATPLLPLSQGNAGGWAFSVDEFNLTILANMPVNAGFLGRVHVPLFSAQPGPNTPGCNTSMPIEKDCFLYDAFIEPGTNGGGVKYRMTVKTGNQPMCANMWKSGHVVINPGSQINMEIENNEFKVFAKLSGTVKINESLSPNIDIGIPDITFQNLVVRNKAPYFEPGIWGFPISLNTGKTFAGFGLEFNNIQMVESNGEPALSFDAGINISDGKVDITALGGFLIRGQMVPVGNRQRWVYKNFKVSDIFLGASFPGVDTLEGILSFYEGDQTYGTGFRGAVKMKITGLAEVSAVAQFGRVTQPTNFKYFFVDAMACLENGIGGALKLTGFGGGVYNHMNRPGSSPGLPLCSSMPMGIPPQLGASLSGIIYTPDASKGLGIKATIAMATAIKENAFNGNATVELLFNAGGGLSDLWIYGNARFMEPPKVNAHPGKTTNNGAPMRSDLDIHMNFNTRTLDGNLEVYMNIGGVIRGSGPGDQLVKATMHIAPGDWFIKVGTPSQRCGMIISIPGIGTISETASYFQIGKNLDPMPALPDEIAKLTSTEYAGLSSRGQALGGNGFIMGSDMQFGKRDMTFLIFYAGLKIRLGFDMALLDYGPNAVCANTGNQVGINGWYASGQVYTGLWGDVGIKVRVFGKRKKFKIFSVAVATSMQASLPNPFWAKGSVGGEFSVMGGLVKGHCDFDVNLGEKCQITGADLPNPDIAIVQRISPEEGTTGVVVDDKPQVYFNFPMNQDFEIEDDNGNKTKYHASLDKATLRYYGLEVSSKVSWAADRKSLIIQPDWYMPDQDTVEVIVNSHVDSLGIRIYEEERIAKFVTGPGLRHIPPANVLGSYPLDGQFNFYPDQIPDDQKGYILLERGQPGLFWGEGKEKLCVRFQTKNGPVKEVPLDYNGYAERVDFKIPDGFFQAGKIYRMQVMRKGNNKRAAGSSAASDDEILYTAYFRTSQHATFGAKLQAWNAAKQQSQNGLKIQADAPMEPFDEKELSRIDITADLGSSNWYQNYILPALYKEDYDCTPICLPANHVRPEKKVSLKPVSSNTSAPHVTEQHWLAGSIPGGGTVSTRLTYDALSSIKADWDYIQNEANGLITGNILVFLETLQPGDPCEAGICNPGCNPMGYQVPEHIRNMYCNGAFPPPPSGNYKVIVRYKMPGAGWGSEQVITITR